MNRLFTGIVIVIVTPLLYVAAVTFTKMPPPITYERPGNCVPGERDYPDAREGDTFRSMDELMCYYGYLEPEPTVNTIGTSFAVLTLSTMLFGLNIIVRVIYVRLAQEKVQKRSSR